jgi:excisionase family DNA binding protein
MANRKKKEDDDLVTISQAARLRGVSPQAIDDLIGRGRLSAVKVAGLRLLKRADVVNFKPSKGGRKAKE